MVNPSRLNLPTYLIFSSSFTQKQFYQGVARSERYGLQLIWNASSPRAKLFRQTLRSLLVGFVTGISDYFFFLK